MTIAPAVMPCVYVLDDNQTIADLHVLVLSKEGMEARAFYKASALFEAIAMREPDLVISDVKMPEMGGLEVASILMKRHPHCKILLCSGHLHSAVLADIAAVTGYAFELLSKPVEPSILLAKLREMLSSSSPNHALTQQP